MNQNLNKRFEMAAMQHNASRLRKVLFSPWRMLYPEVVELMAKRLDVAIPVYAKTFFGEKMKVFLPEIVSTSIYRFGFFEEGLTAIILKYLKPGMIFFDIGSHFGFFSLLASHIVGESGQVHAFEPTRSTFDVLKENAREKKNIFLNQNALWSHNTSITFNDQGIAHSAFNSAFEPRLYEKVKENIKVNKYKVEAISVDAYVNTVGAIPDFIKIDAESAEREILIGMEKLLERASPIIALEVGDADIENSVPSRELVKYLLNKGYQALEFKGGELREHVLRDKYEYDNLVFVPLQIKT
jgi:FkbM family methyltransferase